MGKFYQERTRAGWSSRKGSEEQEKEPGREKGREFLQETPDEEFVSGWEPGSAECPAVRWEFHLAGKFKRKRRNARIDPL